MARKRQQTKKADRSRLSNFEGRRNVRASFDASKTTPDNMAHWSVADALSADAEADSNVRATLRKRCRYEVANNSYAAGLEQLLVNDTIGTGPRLQVNSENDKLNDSIEMSFLRWSESVRLQEILALMRSARCHDGETFAVIGTNPMVDGNVKIDLTVVEADQIQGDDDTEDSESYVDGIRYDKYGNPTSYRMLKYHPGSKSGNDETAIIIKSPYMLHTFLRKRPGLHRGIPELTPALPLFAQLRRYNLATLAAAEAAADFSAILYTDTPANGESDSIEPLDSVPLERNMMTTMPAGWKLGQLDPKHPTSNHSEFVKCILTEVARSVCATYGTTSGDFSGFTYASGKLDNQVYQKSIVVDRKRWELDVLNPLFNIWIREWCLANSVRFEDDYYLPHEWFWDAFVPVDPVKEAEAQRIRLESHTTTLADEYAREGKDYMQKLTQLGKEIDMMRKLGILPNEMTSEKKPAENKNKKKEQENAED